MKEELYRCLFVNPDFPPPFIGGTVVYYHHIHQVFGPTDVVIMTSAVSDSKVFDMAQPYEVCRTHLLAPTALELPPVRKALDLVLLTVKLLFRVLRDRVRVVHIGQMYPMAVVGWLLSRLTGCAFIITVLGEELTCMPADGSFRDRMVRFALRRASRVVTISYFTQRVLEENGVPSERIVLIPPGVDSGKCQSASPRPPAGLEYLSKSPYLLTVGRLTPRKGHDVALQAFSRVLREETALHYVVAGSGEDEARLKSVIKEMGIADKVHLLSEASDDVVAWLYQHCKLFLSPNRTLPNGDTEGFGIVFLEAGYWGKAVIGGRAGGVIDAVDDGVTGLLVDGTKVDDVVDALQRLLKNPQMAERMGAAGRVKAAKADWSVRSQALLALVRSL